MSLGLQEPDQGPAEEEDFPSQPLPGAQGFCYRDQAGFFQGRGAPEGEEEKEEAESGRNLH